ncbi:MAG: tetratricopeptide repeat protein [Alphaproteobacteria bacterium]|nr:tetratricopeptide repeat protein [Alphaproteobacteria bacterium]
MTDAGGETQISGALLLPPAPRYEDEEAESLGEKLAELYTRREKKSDAKLEAQIESTRRELRRGPRLRPGEFLRDGRYRLIERMGESGGDATWKAWDRENKTLVVVKEMVGPWVAKKMRVGAFLEAARTLQGIEHAGLGRIHEATQSRDGFVYLATDYFDGGTLEKGWSGDSVDVLQVVVEVGNALQAAHEAELVHGRVAPNNIHFGLDGGAHLVDFDLAGEHVQEERANVYAAPESVERGQRATPASDVYGLAMCALYGLAGGKLPYTVVRNPNKFIDGLDVSEVVRDVLKRAVDWDIDTRYATMKDFVEALLADGTVLESLAERALERKRYVIASEHYTRLWSVKPGKSVEIKRILGVIYLRMSAWEEAFECLSTALEETATPEDLFVLLREYAEGTDGWKRVADVLWNQARERPPVRRAAMRAELARITEDKLDDPQGASEIWAMVVVDHRLPERGEEALRALKRLAEAREDWAAFVEHSKALLPYLPEAERPDVQYAIGRAYVKHLADEDSGLYWIDKAEAAGIKPLDMTTELQDLRARRGQWRRVIALMRLEADHEKKVHNASRILLRAATIARSVHLDPEAEAIYENMLERAPQHYPALRELARMRHRAGHDDRAMEAYAQLTSIYDGKSEEPEASERAADHTAYAGLLIDQSRFDDAIGQLEAALALQPDNCEALKLAGPLYLDMGKLEEGAQALERLYQLFKAVKTHGERLEAAIQRADAAWFRGRLAVAMRWYNTVLDTVPEHAEAWWGLAKVALAARGGHPGTDRAPWLANTPDRFTPQEALARLFMGMFTGEALSDWLGRHPLGNSVSDAGATSGRLACAAVDLLTRYGCVDAELFARLATAYPRWERRIRAVEVLWLSGDPEFRFARSYRWAKPAFAANDFLAKSHRIVLPLGDPIRGTLCVDFGNAGHWETLVGTPMPDEVEPDLPEEPRKHEDDVEMPAIEFLLGETVEFEMPSGAWDARIGSSNASDWVVPGLAADHAVLRRRGGSVYIHPVGDADLTVEGEQVGGWRLMGGETVQLGSYMWDIRLTIPEPEPEEEEPSPDHPSMELAAGFEELSDFPDEADPTWEGVDPEASSGPPRVATLEDPAPHEDPAPSEAPDADDAEADEPATEVADEGSEEAAETAESGPQAPEERAPAGPLDDGSDDETVGSSEAGAFEEPPPEEEDEDFEETVGPDIEEEPPAPRVTVLPQDEHSFEVGIPDDDFDDFEDPVVEEEPDPEPASEPEPEAPAAREEEVEDEDSAGDGIAVGIGVSAPMPRPGFRFQPPPPQEVDDDGPVYFDASLIVERFPGDEEEEEPTSATDRDAMFAQLRVEEPLPEKKSDSDYEYEDFEDQVATQIRHNPLLESGFMDLDRPQSEEDSLGPAGDAPTPQWVVQGDVDELDQTMAQEPVLKGDRIALQLPTRDPYSAPELSPVEMTAEEPIAEEPAVEDSAGPEPETQPRTSAILEIMSGPARGTQVAVRGVVALGRDEACEVYLPADPMLAPLHCRFVQTDDSFLVMDNGTERGTVVNGTRVSEAVLSGGETIMVGSTVLRFQVQHV